MAQPVDENVMPQGLQVLLSTRFWEPCRRGHTTENRPEECMFCVDCFEVFCPHCAHDAPGHRLLKIRRYVYRSVVLVTDMDELGVDATRIQAYTINGLKGVHLRPMRRSPLFRPQARSPPCRTCGCWLRSKPNLFCSLTCKENACVSQDDFSGPVAERRYRNIQPHMLPSGGANVQRTHEVDQGLLEDEVDQPLPEAEVDHGPDLPASEPPAEAPVNPRVPVNGSFRLRPRKQAHPERAPFH